MSTLAQFISYISQAKFSDKQTVTDLLTSMFVDPQSFFAQEIPSYADDSKKIALQLQKSMESYSDDEQEKEPIHITTDMENTELEANSIAYHRAFGSIMADDRWWWYFSTKQFIRNIKAAEENPNIIAHFIHASSGGGEAWLLDKAYEAVRDAKKPVITFNEKAAASAGYYLGVAADKIYAYTQNDTIGSIGTMIYFLNWMPYYESLGVKEIEEYATKSDLKNKKFNKLTNGDPKQYIEEELNPLQEQFENAVRAARPKVDALPDNDPALRGETFAAPQAIEKGLIDEIADIEVAILDAYNRGIDWQSKQNTQNKAINLFSN